MSPPKPEKLRRKLESLRRTGGIKSREMESFAKSLGRKSVTRGKEANWINKEFPHLPPVSIPHHGTELKRFTARSILDDFERDVEEHENRALETEESDA